MAASETANSNWVNGTSCSSQVAALRSAAARQKTAVMLVGSIPTRVGRPQNEKIESQIAAVTKDIEAAGGDAGLRSACLGPLEALKARVQAEDSLAHITQAEAEALKESDAATARIEAFLRRASEATPGTGSGKAAAGTALKKKRIVQPSKLVQSPYLETRDDVDGFLGRLARELEQAIANGERIEIR